MLLGASFRFIFSKVGRCKRQKHLVTLFQKKHGHRQSHSKTCVMVTADVRASVVQTMNALYLTLREPSNRDNTYGTSWGQNLGRFVTYVCCKTVKLGRHNRLPDHQCGCSTYQMSCQIESHTAHMGPCWPQQCSQTTCNCTGASSVGQLAKQAKPDMHS